jgi:IS30 family transposase
MKKAHQRRVEKGERQRKIQGELKILVERKLQLGWSPEQLVGRLWLELGISLSAETVYQHVLRDKVFRGGLRWSLRQGSRSKRFQNRNMSTRTRERKNWLEDRPTAANERTQFGHWERDCIVGSRSGAAYLTIVDRKSRYTLLRRVEKVDVPHVAAATESALRPFKSWSKTITNDNGPEFRRDVSLQNKLGIPIYFCDPASPWQRGTVENTNGLIRQYFKKGSAFDDHPPWAATAVENTLNFRPRKTLGYRTPHEVLFKKRVRLLDDDLMHFGLAFSPHNYFRRSFITCRFAPIQDAFRFCLLTYAVGSGTPPDPHAGLAAR